MNHGEIYADTWRQRQDDWMDYVQNDVFLFTAFAYA